MDLGLSGKKNKCFFNSLPFIDPLKGELKILNEDYYLESTIFLPDRSFI